MTKQTLGIIVFFLVGALAPTAEAPALSEADGGTAARAIADGFVDAWNRHDMNAFAALFADDADFVNVVGVRMRGRAEIQKHHEAIHATRMKTSHLKTLEMDVRSLRPDVAIVHVRWELTDQIAPDGTPLPTRQGILFHVVARTGGKWLIASSQNTDIVALPAAPQSRQ
jgi:uncharacterized protein (TIGR02246 family)